MKTIGLIGGMSWESTVTYYQIINEVIKEQLGELHSAKILLYSVDFQEIEECQSKGNWEKCAEILTGVACSLEKGGADFIAICTNTMHKVAPQIQDNIKIPIIHIADATAEALKTNSMKKVALLGTKYTMQQDFYKEIIIANDIKVIIPGERDMEIVNSVIYEQLCRGIVSSNSKQEYLRIIAELKNNGAEGVILGCTEIGLLIKPEDTDLLIFDTTKIHSNKIALYALEGGF